MFSQHPAMAKEWADKTPDIKNLPERKKVEKHKKNHLVEALVRGGK